MDEENLKAPSSMFAHSTSQGSSQKIASQNEVVAEKSTEGSDAEESLANSFEDISDDEGEVLTKSNKAKSIDTNDNSGDRSIEDVGVPSSSEPNFDSDVAEKSAEEGSIVNSLEEISDEEGEILPENNAGNYSADNEGIVDGSNEDVGVPRSPEPNFDSDVAEKSAEEGSIVNSLEEISDEEGEILPENNAGNYSANNEGIVDGSNEVVSVCSLSEANLDSDDPEKSAVGSEVETSLVNSLESGSDGEGEILTKSSKAKSVEINDNSEDGSIEVLAEFSLPEPNLDAEKSAERYEEGEIIYESIEVNVISNEKVSVESMEDKKLETNDKGEVEVMNVSSENEEIVVLSSGEENSVDIENSFSKHDDFSQKSMDAPDCEDSANESHGKKSRAVDESSIPYYSLPKPQEYGSFKSTVAKNLEIRAERSPRPKRVAISKSPDCKEDDIIFLGVFQTPPKMHPDPSKTPYISANSGQSSAVPAIPRVLNPKCDISQRFSPAETLQWQRNSSRPDSTTCETPGAKHLMLKKNLMEKMKLSKEKKFIKQKELESIDNEVEEECEEIEESDMEEDCDVVGNEEAECGSTIVDPDSDIDVVGPDSSAHDENRDCDSPLIFSSLPSYQPGGGFKSQEKGKETTYDEASSECELFVENVVVNLDSDICKEMNFETLSSSKSEDLCKEKSDLKITDKSSWRNSNDFDEDSVSEFCSGAFPATNANSDHGSENSVSSWKSKKEENISPSTDLNECLVCDTPPSGSPDKAISTQVKRKRIYSEEEDEGEASSLEEGEIRDDTPVPSPRKFMAKSKNRRYLSDSEDEEVDVEMDDNPQQSMQDFNSRKRLYQDFIEEEAELSGEEFFSSDESVDELSVIEEVEEEEVDVPEEEIFELGKIHLKKMNADEDQLLKKIKNDFLDEGELHNEDGERSRKFRWSAASTSQDVAMIDSSDSEEENKVHVDQEKLKWQKEASAASALEELPEAQPPAAKKIKMNILSKSNVSVKENGAEKKSKVKRGSFLKKDAEVKEKTKDAAKKTCTPKGITFGTTQKKPPADSL